MNQAEIIQAMQKYVEELKQALRRCDVPSNVQNIADYQECFFDFIYDKGLHKGFCSFLAATLKIEIGSSRNSAQALNTFFRDLAPEGIVLTTDDWPLVLENKELETILEEYADKSGLPDHWLCRLDSYPFDGIKGQIKARIWLYEQILKNHERRSATVG